ncbi:MAG: aminotransferase class V-fold PLP-dependent enzyme [Dehalococcoidia bacterium]|nr:aminotransferase class V-fold PLP-dependent enzyme [Dehalococcoidia bacterium]
MNESARESVCLDELQAAASKVISHITHAEAGIVTTGASAALTLGTAACIAGFDVARMNRLPDTAGMPNEVIMPWHQISGYSHAIRTAGARIIGVGIPNDTALPHEVYIISKWDIESAITEKTVAIAYAPRPGSHPPLEEVIEIAKNHNIPVILDAAAEVPPVENLYRFIDMGADLVCFSGGKGIRGPQASGILCGRRDLVASAVIQMLDMSGELFDEWKPPASLIPKEKLCGKPEHGIGRGMKVTKEAIIGLLVALQNLTEGKFAKKAEHLRQLLGSIQARLQGIAGLEMRVFEGYVGYPTLEVKIDEKIVGQSAYKVACKLKEGDPSIYIRDSHLHKGLLMVDSLNMDEEVARIVGERLYATLTA